MQKPSGVLGVTGDHKLGLTVMSGQRQIQCLYQGVFLVVFACLINV